MPRNSCCEMRVTQCMTCLTNSNQSQHTDTVLTQAPPVSINMPITFIIFHILHLITSSWSFFTLLEHYGVIFYNVKNTRMRKSLTSSISDFLHPGIPSLYFIVFVFSLFNPNPYMLFRFTLLLPLLQQALHPASPGIYRGSVSGSCLSYRN